VVVSALKRWAQSGQGSEEALIEDLRGNFAARAIIRQMHDVDITTTTPLRALQMLNELQQLVYQAPPAIEQPEQ
jgi:hypothetical protein